jgi:hypothetical protein
VLAPIRMIEAMRRAVQETIAAGGCLTLLFHPFLLRDEERFAAMREVLEFVSDCLDVWSAPCRELADWALAAPEAFASEDPELDERSWR